MSSFQTGGTYGRVEIQGRLPSWADVFAVFAAKTAGAADGESVAVLNTDTVEKLRTVFWDMTKITTAEADVEHPAEGDADAWMEKVLTITVTPRTPDDMRVFYAFTDQQNAALDELLTAANREMWNTLLYGPSGEIVAVALSQVGATWAASPTGAGTASTAGWSGAPALSAGAPTSAATLTLG